MPCPSLSWEGKGKERRGRKIPTTRRRVRQPFAPPTAATQPGGSSSLSPASLFYFRPGLKAKSGQRGRRKASQASALDRKFLWSQRRLYSHLGGRTLFSSQREHPGLIRRLNPLEGETWLWSGTRVPCPKANAEWCEMVSSWLACSVTCRLPGPSLLSRALVSIPEPPDPMTHSHKSGYDKATTRGWGRRSRGVSDRKALI